MLLFGHERHAASSEGKAAAKIDVVDLPVGSVLNKTTVEAVDRDAALLVGTDDRAASTPARVHPDGDVVRCLAGVGNRCGLRLRSDRPERGFSGGRGGARREGHGKNDVKVQKPRPWQTKRRKPAERPAAAGGPESGLMPPLRPRASLACEYLRRRTGNPFGPVRCPLKRVTESMNLVMWVDSCFSRSSWPG